MTDGADKDVAQPHGKSSPWSDRRSGLEMLRAGEPMVPVQTSEERWLEGLRATDATWREWRGIERMRLWEALALHHHLDPRALGLMDSSNTRFNLITKKYAVNTDSVLGIFVCQAAWILDHVRIGCLPVEETCDPLADSLVSVQAFLSFASGNRVLADSGGKRGPPGLDELVQAPHKYSSPYIGAVFAASALYRTVAEGGRYIPGDHSTVPDVYGFLREHFPGFPPTKLRQICEMARPHDLPKGRKPTRKGTLS